MFVHFKRYARVYHRRKGIYGNVVAPGPGLKMVMFAVSDAPVIPVNRSDLRVLRWWERLLNR